MSLQKPKKQLKRNVITLQEKIDILEQLKKGGKIATIAKSCKLNESTIRTIKRNEVKIRQNILAGCSTTSKRSDCARDIDMVKMEEALIIWIEDCNKKRIPLDGRSIRHKAMKIYEYIKETGHSCAQQQQNSFSASKGWMENFKKRYMMHNLKLQGESASANAVTASLFAPELLKIIQNGGYNTVLNNTEPINHVIQGIPVINDDIIVRDDIKSSSEESPNFSISDVKEGFDLAKNLEIHFIKKDPCLSRRRTFKRNLKILLAPYEKLLKLPTNKEPSFFSNNDFTKENISSNEDRSLIRRKKIYRLDYYSD